MFLVHVWFPGAEVCPSGPTLHLHEMHRWRLEMTGGVAAAIWLCLGDSRTMDVAEGLVRAMALGDGEWKGKPWP